MACLPSVFVEWWKALRVEGIVPPETCRMIIDIDWAGDQPIKVYYEVMGDKKMFTPNLIAALKTADVTRPGFEEMRL